MLVNTLVLQLQMHLLMASKHASLTPNTLRNFRFMYVNAHCLLGFLT